MTLRFIHKFKDGLEVCMSADLSGPIPKIICVPPMFMGDKDATPERASEYELFRQHAAEEIEAKMIDKTGSSYEWVRAIT